LSNDNYLTISSQIFFAGKGRPTMDWPIRLKIALGSAKGLAYLHEDCEFHLSHLCAPNYFEWFEVTS